MCLIQNWTNRYYSVQYAILQNKNTHRKAQVYKQTLFEKRNLQTTNETLKQLLCHKQETSLFQ